MLPAILKVRIFAKQKLFFFLVTYLISKLRKFAYIYNTDKVFKYRRYMYWALGRGR